MSQMKDFLSQFKTVQKRIAKWPKWMQREARTATASFPKKIASKGGDQGEGK